MVTSSSVPPPNTPLTDINGTIQPAWYRYLVSLTATADGASAGAVNTNPGSGLTGGGQVSGGISISIADNGVSNSKLRQSAGTSVIGRFANSTGNVSDIIAGLNNSVLTRRGNQLFFSTTLILAGELECGSLRVDETPTAAVVVQSHWIPISIGGVTYKLLLST